jgi:hypothetical protein
MILKKGKFYHDGKEVPLQFGNRLQIQLIQKALHDAENGAPVDIRVNEVTTWIISAQYTCPICNQARLEESVIFEDWEPDNQDIKEFIEEIDYCHKCKTYFDLIDEGGNQYRLKPEEKE